MPGGPQVLGSCRSPPAPQGTALSRGALGASRACPAPPRPAPPGPHSQSAAAAGQRVASGKLSRGAGSREAVTPRRRGDCSISRRAGGEAEAGWNHSGGLMAPAGPRWGGGGASPRRWRPRDGGGRGRGAEGCARSGRGGSAGERQQLPLSTPRAAVTAQRSAAAMARLFALSLACVSLTALCLSCLSGLAAGNTDAGSAGEWPHRVADGAAPPPLPRPARGSAVRGARRAPGQAAWPALRSLLRRARRGKRRVGCGWGAPACRLSAVRSGSGPSRSSTASVRQQRCHP